MQTHVPREVAIGPERNINLAASNLNFSPWTIAWGGISRLRHDLDMLEDEANTPGRIFNGRLDITPTRRLIIDSYLGKLHPGDALDVHQAWATGIGQGIRNQPSLRSAGVNAAAYALLPETHRSMRTIKRMSKQLGGVTLTVYADQGSEQFMDISDKVMIATQINPEDAIAHQGNQYHEYIEWLREQGIRGVIADNHHLLQGSDFTRNNFNWWGVLNAVEETKMPIVGLHASAGRQDAKQKADRDRSQQDLNAIFQGPGAIAKREMGEILAVSYVVWQRQQSQQVSAARGSDKLMPVSLEVPHTGLKTYWQEHFGNARLKRTDFLSMSHDLGTSLHEFFNHYAARLDE